jgi:hypothetical protein
MGSIERFLAHAGVAWCSVSTLAHAEAPAVTAEPSRAQCVANHERAQDARLAGQLLSARGLLRDCSAAACPALVSRDCVQWLSEVEQQIPSVIFRAAKDGEDVVALHVREGDRLLTESLTGSALELDPGPHHFVAELPGFPAQDAIYVLQAGDKARVVRFDFTSPRATAPVAVSPPSAPPPPTMALPPEQRPVPTLTFVLGGATLAATVTGAVLGGLALSKRKEVQQSCAPLCEDRDLRSIKGLALASDVAFAAALLGAGATLYSYVARPSVPAAEVSVLAPRTPSLRVAWTGWGIVAGGDF